MGTKWLEDVLWPKPPKVICFEKRGKGEILTCRVAVEKDSATVLGKDGRSSRCFDWGDQSEAKAVEYVERLGYVRASDWQLPPQT